MTLPTPAIYNRSELVKFGLENAPCKLCFIDALDDNDLFFSYGQWLNEKLLYLKKGIVDETFEYQVNSKSGDVIWINQKNSLIKDEFYEINFTSNTCHVL